MKNTIPYGYKTVNGKAVIEQTEAGKIQNLFKFYLDGYSLQKAGKLANIKACHAHIGNILKNIKYLGDGYYPQIIENELFDAVQKAREKRTEIFKPRINKKEIPPVVYPVCFVMGIPDKLSGDPFRQAEYMYSLIEVCDNGK